MGLRGEYNILEYVSGVPLILVGVFALMGILVLFEAIDSYSDNTKKRTIRVMGVGALFIVTAIIICLTDGTLKKSFYAENEDQFLEDIGVRFVENEKYQKSEQVISNVKLVETNPIYEGQKIQKIYIDHWLKGGDKKTPEIKIELENGSTFLIKDGEKLLSKGDTQEEDLYFIFKLDSDRIHFFGRENNEWIIDDAFHKNIELIRGKKQLEETINRMNR